MDRMTKLIIRCKVMQYPNLRNKIAGDIADVCETGANNGIIGGKSSSRTTRGFDDRLAQIMSREDYLWCKAIESSVRYFEERGREDVVKAVELLYWKNEVNADGVAYRLHLSRRRVYDYIDVFFEETSRNALKGGIKLA